MKKLIRISLTAPVQFDAPLGVQKHVKTHEGPRELAKLVDHGNGDVSVFVIGSRYEHEHLIHRESIVERLYEGTDEPKVEHWKTREKREREEAKAAQ